jgi:septum site-determining protein MinC
MEKANEQAHQLSPEPEYDVGVQANHAQASALHDDAPGIDGAGAEDRLHVPETDEGSSVFSAERNGAGPHSEDNPHLHDSPAEVESSAPPSAAEEHAESADRVVGAELEVASTLRSAVKIKGRSGAVSVELGDGEWVDLMHLLEERLASAEGFFRGGKVLLEVGPRPVSEEQLREVRRILEVHQMKLGLVRATAERTLQAAHALGVSTSLDEVDAFLEPELEAPRSAPLQPAAPRPVAPFVHRGNLRSGQVLRKTEAVVVIGDVNPGAHVISGGDIMIWGRLRGVAYAGADGNRRAVVSALEFTPTQLRIANLTTVSPEPKQRRMRWPWKKEAANRAEIARIVDGRIVVEPWDDAKQGGPARLRPRGS